MNKPTCILVLRNMKTGEERWVTWPYISAYTLAVAAVSVFSFWLGTIS